MTAICEFEAVHEHGLQVKPSPKYPALHLHMDVSVVVLSAQSIVWIAFGEHVLHAEQLDPLP